MMRSVAVFIAAPVLVAALSVGSAGLQGPGGSAPPSGPASPERAKPATSSAGPTPATSSAGPTPADARQAVAERTVAQRSQSGQDDAAPTAGRILGVSVDGLPDDVSLLHSFEQLVGRNVDLANYYVDFTTPSFDSAGATGLTKLGVTPMITWQPMDSNLSDPVQQPAYSLATIISGKWDSLLSTWARGIAQWKQPVLVRFAHEMNGNWYPWAEGVNGNTSGQYVEAWRHVHDLFVANGATNVKWVWSPNVDYPGSTSLRELYPGDRYVDYVGIDGYNWGTSQSWSGWQTPAQVFNPTLSDVRTFTHKPVLITEVASAEQGGSKASWISHFFAWMNQHAGVSGFVWFDYDKEADWRVNSSTSSLNAFVSGLADYAIALSNPASGK